MRTIFVFIFSLAFTVMYCQTRPNNFTEVLNPNNDNFEVYSQKNGLPRRASLNNLKKFFDQDIYISNDTLYLTGQEENFFTLLLNYRLLNTNADVDTSGIGNNFILKYNTSTENWEVHTDTLLLGTINLQDYGSGDKEAADLGKTSSGYFLEIATDGTLIEKPTSSISVSTTLSGLDDVDTSSLGNNYIVKYNSLSGNWEAEQHNFNSLTDGWADTDQSYISLITQQYNPFNSIVLGHNNHFFKSANGTIAIGNNLGFGGQSSSPGYDNVFIGNYTADTLTGTNGAVHIGYNAGKNTENTSYNTLIGNNAGSSIESNSYNTIVGARSGLYLNSGENNIVLGYNSVTVANSSLIQSLDNSTILGSRSQPKSNGDINSIIIGYQSYGRGSNSTVIGNASIDSAYIYGSFNLPDYGAGNKEASDLNKTSSGYYLEVATDGTVMEKPLSQIGGVSNYSDLGDVDVTGIANNYFSIYNSDSSEWQVRLHDFNSLTDGYNDGSGGISLISKPSYNSNSIIFGRNSFQGASITSSVVMGNNIGIGATTNSSSVLIGHATASLLTGGDLVHVGNGAGYGTTSGNLNVMLGRETGYGNEDGSQNTYLGAYAGYFLNGNNNLLAGVDAGFNAQTLENSVILGKGANAKNNNGDTNEIVIGATATGEGSNTVTIGNDNITATYLKGTTNLKGYGLGNKKSSDLSKTSSGYYLEVATDGTIMEVSPNVSAFQTIGSSNSVDTITTLAKLNSVTLSTENNRSQFNVNVSSLADVRTLSFVIDLTVGTRQTETIIKVDDASNQSNMDMTTLMFPEITVYDLAPTLLDVKQAYNVTETLTNGDLPHNITWNNDGTYNIVFGQGDWGSKSKVLVTIKF